MANRLILRDNRDYPWGKVTAHIFWVGGGQDSVWVNESGIGEFSGTGNIKHVDVAGEILYSDPSRVDGRTTVMARSNRSH